MEHSFLDKYSNLDSPVHRIDARIKTVASFIYILLIVLTPPEYAFLFGVYALVLAALTFTSRLPARFVIMRSLTILPFVGMVALFLLFTGDFLKFSFILIKAYLATLCMILLSSTTKFNYLLKALQSLRIPKIMILILSFMYRYIFILLDEILRMRRAMASRNITCSSPGLSPGYWFQIKTLAGLIGALFVRSYERAERVYCAMCSRGFTGEIQ